VSFAANKVRTRGPTHWRHVSLCNLFIWLHICKIYMGSPWGSTPGPSPLPKPLKHSASRHTRTCSLFERREISYLTLQLCYVGKGGRAGA
jgi:hypothetical protein